MRRHSRKSKLAGRGSYKEGIGQADMMRDPAILIAAFLLDLAIGDPRWLPHPVRIMGRGVTAMERFLRRRTGTGNERAAGVLLVMSIVAPAIAIALLLQMCLGPRTTNVMTVPGTIILVYLTATTLALRGLVDAARLVLAEVRKGNIEAARKELSMVVGRDTGNLSEEGVLRATIETLAENLSDGFIAPLFYLVIGGLPLAIGYKAINTLDSMVGYKNEKYINFGRAAAKLDDLANYVPARITGLLLVAAAFLSSLFRGAPRSSSLAGNAFRIMLRDGRNHTSPNSGVPEAAMAGALGVRLGGTSLYGGKPVEKPFIGDSGTGDYRTAASRALSLVVIAASTAMAVSLCIMSIGVRP